MTSLKNHSSLVASQSLTSCTTENEHVGMHGGDRFFLSPSSIPCHHKHNSLLLLLPSSFSQQATHFKVSHINWNQSKSTDCIEMKLHFELTYEEYLYFNTCSLTSTPSVLFYFTLILTFLKFSVSMLGIAMQTISVKVT